MLSVLVFVMVYSAVLNLYADDLILMSRKCEVGFFVTREGI